MLRKFILIKFGPNLDKNLQRFKVLLIKFEHKPQIKIVCKRKLLIV